MSELTVLSAVRAGREEQLRGTLRRLHSDGGPRPFAGDRTHFARLVVIEMDGPRLLFTSRFDGDEESYLAAIARAPVAPAVWGECEIVGEPTAETLLDHLRDPRLRLQSNYVISLLAPGVTVAEVRTALALRRELSAFALHAQDLAAVDLAHAFAQLPAAPGGRS
jgi:hypothetical protein